SFGCWFFTIGAAASRLATWNDLIVPLRRVIRGTQVVGIIPSRKQANVVQCEVCLRPTIYTQQFYPWKSPKCLHKSTLYNQQISSHLRLIPSIGGGYQHEKDPVGFALVQLFLGIYSNQHARYLCSAFPQLPS